MDALILNYKAGFRPRLRGTNLKLESMKSSYQVAMSSGFRPRLRGTNLKQ